VKEKTLEWLEVVAWDRGRVILIFELMSKIK
jgi:hypothetical protein